MEFTGEHGCEKLLGSKLPFWDKITKEEREALCAGTREAVCAKGETIHGSKGECTGGIFVASGQLRVYMISEDGREMTLYRLYEGDICMLSASCVLKSITFDVFVDAEVESKVYIVSQSVFAALIKSNVYVENFALNIAASRFSDVVWSMQQILFMKADRRLAVFLIDELSRTGGDTVTLTHEQIAKYMGSAREVVTRLLKEFTLSGITEVSRGGIKIINRKKLSELAYG